MAMPLVKRYGSKIPIQRVRLEGVPPKLATTPDVPNPSIELESTPFGQVKIKLGAEEITLPGALLLAGIATVSQTKT